jgi:FdhE protein
VAGSFLGKWFGGPRAAAPEVEEARVELQRLAAARPGLSGHIQWLREIMPDLSPLNIDAPNFSLEQGRTKLNSGLPLLRSEQIAVDVTAFRRRWQRVCESLETRQGDGVAAALAEAMRRGRLDPGELTAAVLAGRPEEVRTRAERLELDPGLASTVLRFTLFPLFSALAASLEPNRSGVNWEQGYCPTCGSWPLLGEFRGLDQARFLRCGLCATGWEVPRLWCPFCGNRDHERLGFLHAEGEEAASRVAICEACRGYVKMVSSLSALTPLRLLVADVATLHLDLAAAERGHTNHF